MFRRFLAIAGIGVVLATGAAAIWLWTALAWRSPESEGPVVTEIASGASVREIGAQLAERGMIRDATAFVLLARWRGLDRRVRSGRYELPGGQTMNQVLDDLVSGRRRLALVTIPEGLTIAEIATLLERRGIGTADEFRTAARDPGLIAALELPGSPTDLEGYLFPDSYDFRESAKPAEILERMTRRFRQVFTPEMTQEAAAMDLTVHQAVTLASLIEEEAAVASERPLISAVFHNRLRRGMPLQSDPSAIYGVEGHSGPIRREDVQRPTSHNTYVRPGLPPGPIANPGRESLEAAVRPAAGVNALYFVARRDRTHEFSDDYAAHQRAVNRYLRSRP